jgi:hypothetical protein
LGHCILIIIIIISGQFMNDHNWDSNVCRPDLPSG